MMWAAVVGREEMRRLHDAEERWGGAPDVPMRTLCALGLTFMQRALGGEVVAAGAGVGYCGILWEKEGVWGGDTGRGRLTIFSS